MGCLGLLCQGFPLRSSRVLRGVGCSAPPTLAMVHAHGCFHEAWSHFQSTRAFSHPMMCEQGKGENPGDNGIGGELEIRAKSKVRRP